VVRQIFARVRWLKPPGPNAMAGVTMRMGFDNYPSLGAYVGLGVDNVNFNGRFHQSTRHNGVDWPGAKPLAWNDPCKPVHVKMVRRGSSLVSYASPDGETWQRIGAMTIARLDYPVVLVGFFTSSGELENTATAIFDQVEISPADIADADLPDAQEGQGKAGQAVRERPDKRERSERKKSPAQTASPAP